MEIIQHQVFHTLLALAFVLIIMWGVFYIFNKLNIKKWNKNSTKDIKIISGLPLSSKEKVLLLDVQQRKILIGVSQGNIRTLHVFTGEKS